MAPRINRNQILDYNTLSGNENIQNEIKQIQTYNLQSQKDKMQAARLQKFQDDNGDTISDLTNDFYGSIASGNSAYSNHDPIYHQPDNSTVHSSFNNSEITPSYYYNTTTTIIKP